MKANRAISWLMISLVLISVCGVNARSQDKKNSDQDAVKLRAELVQIDVLVTDRNNQPVSGLTREDFALYDNDKLQTLTSFAYEETQRRKIAEVDTEARSLPRAITTGELKRVLAFVVDTLHMKYTSIYRTRKILDDFIDHQMEPGDLVLILSTGGGSGLVQQFTADQRLLHRAVSRLHPLYFTNTTTPYRTLGNPFPSLRGDPRGMSRVQGGLSMPDVGVARTSGNIDPLEAADARTTLRTLDEVIKSMSKLPGRKVSVFVSEGLRIFQTDTKSDLRETSARAARANVVFYSIDPRGLEPLTLGADDSIDTDEYTSLTEAINEATNVKRNDFFESQESLKALAEETGGKFFGNNNDIKHGLEVFLKENSAYYMLGFQPEQARWDGKFHKIKVVVRNRPDLTVSFRKGYMARSEKPEGQKVPDPLIAEALEAISSPLVRREIDLRLTPLYLDDGQREPVVTVMLHIDASKLNFKQAQDTYQDSLDQVGYIYDTSGKVVDHFGNKIELNLKPQTYESALKRGLLATHRLSLKPGLYQVRLFIRESGSGKIGTANDNFEVPNFKGEHLVMSSLFLQGTGNGEGGDGATLSQRRFQRNGSFTYQAVVYNAKVDGKTNQPQLEMRTRVWKGSQVVFKGTPRPVQAAAGSTPPARIITGGTFQMKGLAPDEYTLEITVVDKLRKKDAIVRQEIDFTVE